VEIWAEGGDQGLDTLENFLREGPPGAVVRELKSMPGAAEGRYTGFDVTY
jgi:acylphosphatase